MYMYVHSKGAEGLKKGSYEEDIVREGVSSKPSVGFLVQQRK